MTSQAKRERLPAASFSGPARPLSSAPAIDRGGVPRWLLAIVVMLPLILFSIDLGTPSLWDPDEGLAAEVAREMLLTRQWLTPQLNFVPYMEKPSLYFWTLAAAMRLFGSSNEAATGCPRSCCRSPGCGWRCPGGGAICARSPRRSPRRARVPGT